MSYLTPSFNRLLANIRQAGWKRESDNLVSVPVTWAVSAVLTPGIGVAFAEAWRDYQYIGEPKFGKLMGQDE